jgi:hypothetical protein
MSMRMTESITSATTWRRCGPRGSGWWSICMAIWPGSRRR